MTRLLGLDRARRDLLWPHSRATTLGSRSVAVSVKAAAWWDSFGSIRPFSPAGYWRRRLEAAAAPVGALPRGEGRARVTPQVVATTAR